MRAFTAIDGQGWVARIYEGSEHDGGVAWQVILFDQEQGARQRIAYRPAGWLADASVKDLIAALEEGESVRARWSAE